MFALSGDPRLTVGLGGAYVGLLQGVPVVLLMDR